MFLERNENNVLQCTVLHESFAFAHLYRCNESCIELPCLESLNGILRGTPVNHIVFLNNKPVSVQVFLLFLCKECRSFVQNRDDLQLALIRIHLTGLLHKLCHILRGIVIEARIEPIRCAENIEELLRGFLSHLQGCIEHRRRRMRRRGFHQGIHRFFGSRCRRAGAVQIRKLRGHGFRLAAYIFVLHPCHPCIRQRKHHLHRGHLHHLACVYLAVSEYSRDIDIVITELVHYSTYSKSIVIAFVEKLYGYLVFAQAGILVSYLRISQNTELLLERRTLSRLSAGFLVQRAFTYNEIVLHVLRFLVLCLPDYRAQQLTCQYKTGSTTHR